jgi:membrane peptidoglycan carboxypeptidase
VTSPTATGLETRVGSRLAGRGSALSIDAIAPVMREAVVATEDERFYRHDGIDLIGVTRALPYDLVHLSLAQGASTITEQVAKILYLGGSDRNPWRKLEDATVAVKLDDRYSKEQILAAYLSSVYFGDGANGVASASRDYFGVAPRRLDTAQATLLAGLIRAPEAYDPRTHPSAARARQIEVLRSLVRDGFLRQSQAAAVLARPLQLRAGAALPSVVGVDLSPGPAFVWWKLALGIAIAVAGSGANIASRSPRLRGHGRLLAIRFPALVLLLMGAVTVARSFRSV